MFSFFKALKRLIFKLGLLAGIYFLVSKCHPQQGHGNGTLYWETLQLKYSNRRRHSIKGSNQKTPHVGQQPWFPRDGSTLFLPEGWQGALHWAAWQRKECGPSASHWEPSCPQSASPARHPEMSQKDSQLNSKDKTTSKFGSMSALPVVHHYLLSRFHTVHTTQIWKKEKVQTICAHACRTFQPIISQTWAHL